MKFFVNIFWGDFFKKNFDLTDLEVQKKAFHYTNLQPMWGDENISKGSKLPPQVKKAELN